MGWGSVEHHRTKTKMDQPYKILAILLPLLPIEGAIVHVQVLAEHGMIQVH